MVWLVSIARARMWIWCSGSRLSIVQLSQGEARDRCAVSAVCHRVAAVANVYYQPHRPYHPTPAVYLKSDLKLS